MERSEKLAGRLTHEIVCRECGYISSHTSRSLAVHARDKHIEKEGCRYSMIDVRNLNPLYTQVKQ